eukprot:Hpha_TRINITY_DN4178_c0_g2::TRINITY_DN4178_c0_g2_i1::g.194828::m.194828/K02183/CALM; calmodulin
MPARRKSRRKSERREVYEGLRPEQVQELEEIFELFDADKSGAISVGELGTVMKSMGLKPTAGELESMIARVDKDGTGEIELAEFLELMDERLNDAPLMEQLRRVFDQFDTDGDGAISCADLVDSLRTYAGMEMTAAEAQEVMLEVDEDGTGTIDLAEFITLLSNPK